MIWRKWFHELFFGPKNPRPSPMHEKYPAYYKNVSHLESIDVYRVLELFNVDSHPLGHTAKKILLCGVRTGGKAEEKEIREARDTLQRWLDMREENKRMLLSNESNTGA